MRLCLSMVSGSFVLALLGLSCNSPVQMNTTLLHASLAETVSTLLLDTANIVPERKLELDRMATWVSSELAQSHSAKLTFICTHNSRRSHMAQVWAQVGAAISGLEGVQTFSGGTETTACNPRTVEAMIRAGFAVSPLDTLRGASNPTYAVSAGPVLPIMNCYSKKYQDPGNPDEEFGAVMTCSSADRSCPLVFGASERFSLPYIDPKVSDGTEAEAETYDLRLRQIGTEMLYVMGRVAAALD